MLSMLATYMGGPETLPPGTDWRHLTDTILAYPVDEQNQLAGNDDMSHLLHEKQVAPKASRRDP